MDFIKTTKGINMQDWISVDDKLPNRDQIVKVKGNVWRHGVIVDPNKIEITRYYCNEIFERNVEQDEDYMDITHWKSILKLPKE